MAHENKIITEPAAPHRPVDGTCYRCAVSLIIVHDMNRIEAALPNSVRGKVGFTLITLDTERDTPAALHAYRATRKLPADRWTLLHGAPDDTLELAALLGVKFKREASGQFAHSNLITVLNGQGEVVHQVAGLNQDIQETVKRVNRAAADLPYSSSDRGAMATESCSTLLSLEAPTAKLAFK
jgi:hypothetical protein